MTGQSRSVGIELQIANKSQFISELEALAQKANELFRINPTLQGVTGSRLPSAPSMPTPMSQQAPPSYMGQSNPGVPMRSAESLIQTHAQTVAHMPNATSTASYMKTSPELTQLNQSLQTYATRSMSAISAQMSSQSQQMLQDLRRYSTQLATMGERAQYGMSVNPARAAYLSGKVGAIGSEVAAQRDAYLQSHPVSAMQQQAASLTTRLNTLTSAPPEQQDMAQIRELRQSVDKLLSVSKAMESYDKGLAGMNYAQDIASQIPTGSLSGRIGQHYSTAHNIIRTHLPMYGSILGVEALSNGYQSASSLAVQSGAIGMQAGGVNPTTIFNQLNTMGRTQGFSGSQMAEAVQAQGQFSGTGNMAFLFRDAQQTAQFARYMGINTTQGAQILGSYQLSGAFTAGNEANTAQQIAAAAAASGMNSSAFLSGVQTLAQAGMRTGVQTNGGVATSLAMVNQLGASLNMPLLQNANGVQTLQTLQQGWSAGPGSGSGLYASQLQPLYSAVQKSMAPTYNRMGITNPMVQLASLMQTNISDYPKTMLDPLLTAMHKELTAPGMTGTAKQVTELGMSKFLFGNTSAASLENVSKLAQGGPGFNLSATEKAIKAAQGTLASNASSYQSSVAGNVQTINSNVARIANSLGKFEASVGAPLANPLGSVPGLVNGVVVGGSLMSTYGVLKHVFGFGGGTGGAAGGGLLGRVGKVLGGGTTADATLGGSALTDLTFGTLMSTVGIPLTAGMSLIPNKHAVATVPKTLAQAHDTSLYQLGRFGPGVNSNFSLQETSKNTKQSSDILQKIEQTLKNIYGVQSKTSFGNPNAMPSGWFGQASLAGQGTGYGGSVSAPTIGPILPAPSVSGMSSIAGGSGGVSHYASLINSMASKYGVPANYLAGVMATESGGNPYSINDNTTGKSYSFNSMSQYLAMASKLKGDSLDMGLMQINSLAHPGVSAAQAANPTFALQFAASLLHSDYSATGNSWSKAIEAYNGGLGGVGSRQTQQYLTNVMEHAAQYTQQSKPRPSQKHNLNRKAKMNAG